MTCPSCGSPTQLRKTIETWDQDGTPEEFGEVLYCERCNIAWREEDPDGLVFVEEKRRRT